MKKKWLVAVLFVAGLLGLLPSALAAALPGEARADTSTGSKVAIKLENGIHFIDVDPDYPGKKIVLFCMNNKLRWPHHTEDMGDAVQVPEYSEGYLTPDDFDSREQYDECMRRLSKILYAGHPYNGEHLYKVVENSSAYAPSKADFNKMLICPAVLQTAYPYLGHHEFKYEDWETHNEEHLSLLKTFVQDVVKLSINGGETSNGLTFADISAMPFYKAAFSIGQTTSGTPLEKFQFLYGASYFVTEEEAYNATQNAIWCLLTNFGIADNDIATTSTPLAGVLYTYSERGGLLDYHPSVDEVSVSGDLNFTYNPKDAMWHSGTLRIKEPEIYHGVYKLTLPKGVTAQCDNLNYVYGNEDYELVSDHRPTPGEQFSITAEFKYLEEMKQYSPTPDITFEGKKFQHMVGAAISDAELTFDVPISSKDVGGFAVTKTVTGEPGCAERFGFKVTLYDMGNPDKPAVMNDLNGLYGDFEFHGGVAEFQLGAGEKKQATNLPSGAKYVIEEVDAGDPGLYRPSNPANGVTEGTIGIGEMSEVVFENVRLRSLAISKLVKGDGAPGSEAFDFDIELKDAKGNGLNGEFAYRGGVVPGYEGAVEPLADGKLSVKNGKASIRLSHGQRVTIDGIPHGTRYLVSERLSADGIYDARYDGSSTPANGELVGDIAVNVENVKRPIAPKPPVDPNHSQGAGSGLPRTGDGSMVAVGAVVVLACALIGIGLFIKSRRD